VKTLTTAACICSTPPLQAMQEEVSALQQQPGSRPRVPSVITKVCLVLRTHLTGDYHHVTAELWSGELEPVVEDAWRTPGDEEERGQARRWWRGQDTPVLIFLMETV